MDLKTLLIQVTAKSLLYLKKLNLYMETLIVQPKSKGTANSFKGNYESVESRLQN